VKRILAAALAAAGLILAAAPAAVAQAPADAPVDLAAQDKAFNDAVFAARASLPVFWGRLAENPGVPDDYSLKVVFRNPRGQVEDLWLSDIKRQDGHIFGRLNYDPEHLPNMHRMQVVPIAEGDIIDWTFKEGRKRYGHFTTRVLAKIHPDEAARTMATLSDNPLPADARGH
jgi:uncharacterized protein YegJ (DUF2314 family)